jgi:hypothetical protein
MFQRLGFFGTIGLFVLCLCVLAGVGLYLNWFSISASNTDNKTPDVHVSVNTPRIEADVNTVKKGVAEEYHSLLGEKTVKGTIQQVETAKQELTIKDNPKQDVTVKVDATTKIKVGDKDGSFSDLQIDDPVSVLYDAKKDGNVAKTITVSKTS